MAFQLFGGVGRKRKENREDREGVNRTESGNNSTIARFSPKS